MKRSTDRILTTHVGSLIRPQALQEFLRAKQGGKPYDVKAYQACLTASVAEVVRQQEAAGVDIPSDGEFGKSISWAQYALERLSGFERRPIRQDSANPFKRGADRTQFAEFYAELDAKEAVSTTTEAICVGPIAYTGQAELQTDIDNFKAALKGTKTRRGLHAGGGAGQRHPGPQERVLQERRGAAGGDRGRHAHRIQDDRRCRFRGAARRRAQRRHL